MKASPTLLGKGSPARVEVAYAEVEAVRGGGKGNHAEGKVMVMEELRDVKDFETMDHRMLKQWKEKEKRVKGMCVLTCGLLFLLPLVSCTLTHVLVEFPPCDLPLCWFVGGSCEDVGGRDVRVQGSPVFPHTHIGLPNPLSVPCPGIMPCSGFKDSQSSSFEDLEEECREFSTEVPRSC